MEKQILEFIKELKGQSLITQDIQSKLKENGINTQSDFLERVLEKNGHEIVLFYESHEQLIKVRTIKKWSKMEQEFDLLHTDRDGYVLEIDEIIRGWKL